MCLSVVHFFVLCFGWNVVPPKTMDSVAAALGSLLPPDIVSLIVGTLSATECHVCRRKMVRGTATRFQFCSRKCYEHV